MIRVLRLLTLGLGLLALASWLVTLSGSVTLRYGDWLIDMALPAAIVGSALVLLLLLVLFRIALMLLGLRSGLKRRHQARRWRLGDEALLAGLAALAAEELADARREARKACRLLNDAPRALWLAGEAARRAGASEEAHHALERLNRSGQRKGDRAAQFLAHHGLAQVALTTADAEAAQRHVDAAERIRRGTPGMARLISKIAVVDQRPGPDGHATPAAATRLLAVPESLPPVAHHP